MCNSAMHLDNYRSVEEFLLDERFRRWVMQPDDKDVGSIGAWVQAHPEAELWKEAADIIRTVELDTVDHSGSDVANQWSRIESVLWGGDKREYKETVVSISKGYKRAYRYAAAISFFLLVSFLALLLNDESYARYTTNFGEKERVALADGSVITLNANSSVKVKIDLNDRCREVWLQGEAFFEIDQIERGGIRVPFIVHAGNLDIEVLGTEFNVFNRKTRVQVVLEKGAISINGFDNETINVAPGELVEYAAMEMKRKAVDTELFCSWKDNSWHFEDAPLSMIGAKIEEIYGVAFVIEDDEIADAEMSGALPSSNLDVLLHSISRIYGIEIVEDGNTYRVKRKNPEGN